jgi:hypothetical protein
VDRALLSRCVELTRFRYSSTEFRGELANALGRLSGRPSGEQEGEPKGTRSPSSSEQSNYYSDQSGPAVKAGQQEEKKREGLDPDDAAADYTRSNVFEVRAKTKQTPRTSNSLLGMRGLSRSSAGSQPPASTTPSATPRREPGTSVETESTGGASAPLSDISSQIGDEDDVRLLDDLLKTANDQVESDGVMSPVPESRAESIKSVPASEVASAKKDTDSTSLPGDATTTATSGEVSDSAKGEGKRDARQSAMNPLHPLSAIWSSIRQQRPDSSSNSLPATASPHIKLTFRHNMKKFSVTAWHTARFEALRRACGVSEDT